MKKSRRERTKQGPQGFVLSTVQAMTENQAATFEEWENNQHLVLTGCAGTGKTYIALYLALEAQGRGDFKKVMLVRSAVPSRNIGHLPGNVKEKSESYEDPYRHIVNNLYSRDDAYEVLKTKKVLDFRITSYLRGLTIDDTIVIVDEMQNLSFEELATIITRAGKNTKFIFSGDFDQSDLKGHEKEGIQRFLRILDEMQSFSIIEFEVEDIVRSGLVKEFLIAKRDVDKQS